MIAIKRNRLLVFTNTTLPNHKPQIWPVTSHTICANPEPLDKPLCVRRLWKCQQLTRNHWNYNKTSTKLWKRFGYASTQSFKEKLVTSFAEASYTGLIFVVTLASRLSDRFGIRQVGFEHPFLSFALYWYCRWFPMSFKTLLYFASGAGSLSDFLELFSRLFLALASLFTRIQSLSVLYNL